MPKIKFLRDSGPHESTAPIKAGAVVEVDEASCGRWLKRQAAELVSESAKETKPNAEKKSTKKRGKK